MTDVQVRHETIAANQNPRLSDESYWAAAWLAAWQRCGNSAGADGELIGFVYGRGPDCDPVMTKHLQILLGKTTGGVSMVADHLQKYGDGPVEIRLFDPAPVDESTAFSRVYQAFLAARDALDNALDIGDDGTEIEEIYVEKLRALSQASPDTAMDFVRKFYAIWNDGDGPYDSSTRNMLADAVALGGAA
jgi:hypothetical protein